MLKFTKYTQQNGVKEFTLAQLEDKCQTYSLLDEMRTDGFICQVCQGSGHEFYECPTKKRLDAYAKKMNDSLWGNWKYIKYYKAFIKVPANVE